MPDERCDADDRVVPPIMRFAELPEMQTGGEDRTIDAGRELLRAAIERVASRGLGGRLQDPDVGIRFGDLHESSDALSGHHAVGVEHDHVAIAASPAAAEIGDVAALALDAMRSPAIEDVAEADCPAEVEPAADLCNPCVGISRIGKHEKVEALALSGTMHRLVCRTHPRKHPGNVLV